MCETARDKLLDKIPIILLLFSNFQPTWSNGKPVESQGGEGGIVFGFLQLEMLQNSCLLKKVKVKKGF